MREKKCSYQPPPSLETSFSQPKNVGFFNSKLRRAADANQIINWLWPNLRKKKVCYIFGLCTFEIQAWILLKQIIVTTLYDYWVFVDSLKSLADKKALFYMNVSIVLHERLYYKDFDVNESIQYNYYFSSYCIFISNFRFLQFNLSQTLCCVYVDGEKNFGKFWDMIRGINTV